MAKKPKIILQYQKSDTLRRTIQDIVSQKTNKKNGDVKK